MYFSIFCDKTTLRDEAFGPSWRGIWPPSWRGTLLPSWRSTRLPSTTTLAREGLPNDCLYANIFVLLLDTFNRKQCIFLLSLYRGFLNFDSFHLKSYLMFESLLQISNMWLHSLYTLLITTRKIANNSIIFRFQHEYKFYCFLNKLLKILPFLGFEFKTLVSKWITIDVA